MESDRTQASSATPTARSSFVQWLRHPFAWMRLLGPGLIAGASDNDPTTVASLAVIGSTTGFGLAWLVILVIPMLVVVQVISAAIGTVCRAGLEDVIQT